MGTSWPRYLAGALVVTGAYFAAAKLGLALAYEQGNVTAVWPPTGIALAALVLGGYRYWPGVALGALLANATTDVPALTTLGIATGNTLEAIVGAAILSRARFRPSLTRVRDVFALVACALLSTTVSATIGNLSLLLGDAIEPERFGFFWRLWWLGDVGGDLLVAPVLMVLWGLPRRPRATRRRAAEAAGLLLLIVGTGIAALMPRIPLAFLAFPGLVLAALRFRQLGAVIASLVVAAIAVWTTARGGGPFAGGAPDQSLLESQTFFTVGALTALLLAAVLSEREHAEREVRRSHQLLNAVAEGTPDPVYVKDAEGRYLMMNSAGARGAGRPADEVVGRTATEVFPPEIARGLLEHDRQVMSTGRAHAFEEEIPSADGERTFLSMKSPLIGEDGEVAGVIGISHDITDRKQVEDTQRFLAETSRVLAASLDVEHTLRAVTHAAVPDLADWCAVHLLDEAGAIRPMAVAHVDPEREALVWELVRRYPPDPDAAAGTAKVVRTGRPELLREIPDSLLEAVAQDDEHLRLIRGLGFRAAMIVPLRARGRTVGALALASAESGRTFDERDLSVAEDLANRCALAADNARLYRREQVIAEALQRSLLPDRLPEIPGLAFAARYLPGTAGVDVGGDWYDAVQRPHGDLLVVIGDVAGRGVRAASTMGQLRTAVRAYALEGRSPAGILTGVNRLLHAIGVRDMVTMLCAAYDPESGALRISSAGHLPPLVLGPDGEARTLEDGSSVPLNVDPAASYFDAETRVEPGCTLLLYTDGLVERTRRPLDEGIERLRAVAAEAPRAIEALCDHIVERILGDAERLDDVAILALRTAAVGADRLRIRVPAEPSALGDVRRSLGRWLERAGASPEETFSINLAAGEACANAIEHAYGPVDADVEVEGHVDDRVVTLTIRDSGRWRSPRGQDRGRGLTIMRGIMDSVDLSHDDDGTEVRMSRRLSSAAGSRPSSPPTGDTAARPPEAPASDAMRAHQMRSGGAELRVSWDDGVAIAAIDGEVDMANAQAVFSRLADELGNRASGVVVDLSCTRHLDSAGLQALLELARRTQFRGQKLRVVASPDSPPRQAIEITRLDASVAVETDVADALGALRNQ